MSIQEIVAGGGITLVVLLTLVQITPIKVNPWSAIARWTGKAINGDVLKKLDELEAGQVKTKTQLDEHIRVDDERDADLHRYRILRFNTEVMRKQRHTEEEFNEILYNIKRYEKYCRDHPDYKNNRAVMAIENIERVHKENMRTGDFL